MKKNKKILLIGPVPPPVTGESFCNLTIIKHLGNDSKYEIDYINTSTKKFDEKIGKINFSKLIQNLKNYFQSYKIIKTDLLYATIGQTFLGVVKFMPFFITAKIFHKPIVIHVHGNNLLKQYEKQKGFKKRLFHKIVSMADTGIVLSKNLKHNLTPFLKHDKIFVLPNFISEEILPKNLDFIKQKDFSHLKILYLSNLMTQKGIFELLDALEQLHKDKLNFEATLAGHIDEHIKNRLIEKINKIPEVKYLGNISGAQKKEALKNANLFILPSYREGQPLSIFEAMATGNLVITTEHPGITDIFSSKQVTYIPKKSADDIVKAIYNLHKNLGQKATEIVANYNYIAENFTEKKFVENFKKIIQVDA